VQRDLERVKGQVEFVTERVASELLLFEDDGRRCSVKHLLSLWNECSSTAMNKGNSATEVMVTDVVDLLFPCTVGAGFVSV